MIAGLSFTMGTNVKADENDFDLSNFYVCDEFLEYGTAGRDLDIMPDEGGYEETDENSLLGADGISNQGEPVDTGVIVQALRMSNEGIAMLEGFEGCRLKAYKALSTEKYYTIGYGHYGPDVTEGMVITQEQAEALLRQDLATRENYLNSFASSNGVLFRQNEFDAILSLIFNIGTGNFGDSTIRRYILEGFDNHTEDDYTTAIGMWRKSGGQVIQGLVNRRAKESAYFTRYGIKRPEISEASLGLNGRMGLNLYVNIPEKITSAGGGYFLVVTDTVPQYIYVNNLEHNGQVYCLKNEFTAKEVSKTIAIAFYDPSGIMFPIKNSNMEDGFTFVHSLSVFKNSASASGRGNLAELAESMIQYGSCARDYLGYGSHSPSWDVINVNPSVFEPYRRTLTGSTDGIIYSGSSLILDSGTTIRHYFSLKDGANISDYTFEVGRDGNSANVASVKSKEGLYYIEINNISPADYDIIFSTAVKKAGSENANPLRIGFGVYSYADRVFEGNKSEVLKNMVRAMYRYGQAAKNCL